MARNKVQFQKGISLSEFLQNFGTEDQCFDSLSRIQVSMITSLMWGGVYLFGNLLCM
jgi:hypothetical protein